MIGGTPLPPLHTHNHSTTSHACRRNAGACRCNSTSPIPCCSSPQQRLGESETRFLASFCKPHLLADPGLRKFSSEEPANKENQSSKTNYFLLQPRNIMMRHVIVSSRAFTIEQLVEKSLRSPLRTVKTEVSNMSIWTVERSHTQFLPGRRSHLHGRWRDCV